MLAIFLGALDQTIVAVALPSMAHDLQGFDWLSWVVSGYLLSATLVTPLYGKFSDLIGRRAMLTLALLLFLTSSIGCALSDSMVMLVVFRVLQGMGGGGLISLAQATIADVVSPRERGRYQGYISGMYALASIAGPLFGGVLTESLSWRWIFWINLPLCLLALVISRRALKILPVPRLKHSMDYAGIMLLMGSLLSLLLAFTFLGQRGTWDEVMIGLLCASLVMGVAFIWTERFAAEPIIPLRLFSIHEFSVGLVVLFITFMQIIALIVLVPLQIQLVLGLSASDAAWRLLPLSMGVPLGAFVCGRLMSATGHYKYLQLSGISLAGLGILFLSSVSVASVGLYGIALAITGVGIGAQFPTTLVSIQNAVPRQHIGIATATTALFRSLGASIGVALLSSLLLAQLQNALPQWHLTGGEVIHYGLSAAVVLPEQSLLALRGAAAHAYWLIFVLMAMTSLLSFILGCHLSEQKLQSR
jgi:EmrB/QacA subfamily drug resistance transporter